MWLERLGAITKMGNALLLAYVEHARSEAVKIVPSEPFPGDSSLKLIARAYLLNDNRCLDAHLSTRIQFLYASRQSMSSWPNEAEGVGGGFAYIPTSLT